MYPIQKDSSSSLTFTNPPRSRKFPEKISLAFDFPGNISSSLVSDCRESIHGKSPGGSARWPVPYWEKRAGVEPTHHPEGVQQKNFDGCAHWPLARRDSKDIQDIVTGVND